jgi:hypothetical protein
MSLKDSRIQDKVFGFEKIPELMKEFNVIEEEIAERQESERRFEPEAPVTQTETPVHASH